MALTRPDSQVYSARRRRRGASDCIDGHLRPASRRGAEIDDARATSQDAKTLIYFKELEGCP
jgi:hypothetical protein